MKLKVTLREVLVARENKNLQLQPSADKRTHVSTSTSTTCPSRMERLTVERPALGQSFRLGSLYDGRTERLIPGLTLWDNEEMVKDTKETATPSSEFKILTSETISDKCSALGVEGSLKVSFLSRLVKVSGSARYLNDHKASQRQARVTLKYRSTTTLQELSMTRLRRHNIRPVLDSATHLVTAVLYGAQAFFVFDQHVSETENLQDVQKNLHTMVKRIPSLSTASVRDLKVEQDKISCRFHGDFPLSQNPETFEDGVKVYQALPRVLEAGGAVPLTVWLLPLTSLNPAAAVVLKHISPGLVFQIEETLEDFRDLEMRCQDLLKTPALKQLSQIDEEIKTFMRYCSVFKVRLQTVLGKKLPSVCGGEDEAELAKILQKRRASSFSADRLNQWLKWKVEETNLIQSITKFSEIISSHTELRDRLRTIMFAVCFVLPSSEEPFLAALGLDLEGFASDRPSQRAKAPERVQESVRLRAQMFRAFAEANQQNKAVTFLTVSFKDDNTKSSELCLYKNGVKISDSFEPPAKPEDVKVEDVTHDSVTLSFQASGGATGYRVERCESGGPWQHQCDTKDHTLTVTDLTPDTEYCFRVRAVTDVGLGPATEAQSIQTSPEAEGPWRLAEELRKYCQLLETRGSLQILKIPLQKDKLHIPGCARFIYGQDSMKTNCTIMVMGATGAGKSTLINGMANYLLGVQWTDPYRYKLVVEEETCQSQSQTSTVTVYKLNYHDGFMTDYSLTIIDTPGFGDTRGVVRDREITQQIRNLFSSDFGVNDIHAVCFVAQASLARVTATQRYVFDSVLSIFGNDVAENIRILVTFADGQPPPVLQAIRAAGVPCPKSDDGQPAHYKFNNSALFAENQTSALSFDEMFWNMGKKSMMEFFTALVKTEPKSLTLTKEVLQERKRLEEAVDDIERKLKEGLAKADEIKQTEDQLKEHEAEIARNKDFEVTLKVLKPFQVDISGTGNYITNCQICHFTCHFPCQIGNDADKKQCWAMGPDGNCKKCPGNCLWSQHYNQKYRWEYREVTEKKTVEELKSNYLKGNTQKKTVENLASKLREEYNTLHDSINSMVQKMTRCINRLKQIALKRNPLTAPEYLDMLIESEKKEHKPGWKKRIQSFREMKNKAEIVEIVNTGAEGTD